ncbi:MAG: EAL domain-containing protein [Kangiellaceae bacterium]|nr:EAL domain-containing protein [Kangiellaceae bacterium]
MHKLLQRQISRYLNGQANDLPEEFIAAINDAYNQADDERHLLERSLDITSDESNQRYQDLKQKIDDLEETKRRLENSYRQLNTTMNAGFDGIVHVNLRGEPIAYNDVALEMIGLSREEFEQFDYQKMGDFLAKTIRNPSVILEQLRQPIRNRNQSEAITVELRTGEYFECKAKALHQDGEPIGLVWTIRDVTELKNNEQEAQYRAYHDALTGLPNRTMFKQRLEHALELAKRKDENLAVVFMDLDEFKYVNDTLGHDKGDILLKKVAYRIQTLLREHDTFARLGGDEFVILLEDVEDKDAIVTVLDRIKESFAKPFNLDDNRIYVSSSIGVSTFPEDGGKGERLIKKADMAMYNAKKRGKNTYSFYSSNLERYSRFRLSMHNALRKAIENDEFRLEYQPKIQLIDNKVVGVEALIRWHRGSKIVPPLQFIPEAESNGMIIPISQWVIDQVCKDIALWRSAGYEDSNVSINISTRHFQHGDLLNDIKLSLQKYDVPASCLEIEITESSFIGDIEQAIEKIKQLSKLGIKVSIDDFGTGYSSFTYLSKLPIHELKIDRSFIAQLETSQEQHSLVAAIIRIAHIFGLVVVAEGVESADTVKMLQDALCDQIQGNWFSKPIPSEQFYKKYLAA